MGHSILISYVKRHAKNFIPQANKGVLLTYADRISRVSIIRTHKNRKADVIAQSSIVALESFGA